jgi:hypothetical protein
LGTSVAGVASVGLALRAGEAEVATKKQKARVAGAGKEIPVKAKPKKRTSR